jgi:hypothetical protein
MLLRRNDEQILATYNELWDKVWWNRHQVWLEKIESGEAPLREGQREILGASQDGRCSDRGEIRAREPGLGRLRVGAAQPKDVSFVMGAGRGVGRITRYITYEC